jgi:hypothetical protein
MAKFFISLSSHPWSAAGSAQDRPLDQVWLLSMLESCRGTDLASSGESVPSREDGSNVDCLAGIKSRRSRGINLQLN